MYLFKSSKISEQTQPDEFCRGCETLGSCKVDSIIDCEHVNKLVDKLKMPCSTCHLLKYNPDDDKLYCDIHNCKYYKCGG